MNILRRAQLAASVLGSSAVAAGADIAQKFGTAYRGAAKSGGPFGMWRPAIASPDREWLVERESVVSRARDLARNDATVASAKRRRISSAVGVGWRLSMRVNGELLGFTPEDTLALNRQIERVWQEYAYGPGFEMDAQRQLTFGGLLRAAVGQWFVDGETFAHVEWSPGQLASSWGTRLNLIDGDRVSNPFGTQDGTRTEFGGELRAGIERDLATGAPIAGWVRDRHPNDVAARMTLGAWQRIPRWTDWGRPQFLHMFDRERPGQSRGVSQLAAVMSDLKSLRKFSDATLENAILQALMLGAVKSNGGPGAVSEALSADDAKSFEAARASYYGGNVVDMNGVQLVVLPNGDELQLHQQGREVASFEGFTRAVIRRVSAAVGATYEEVSMDYSTTNYSSARAAMIHAWMETLHAQTMTRDQIVQPHFSAWMEEAIETGRIELPAGAPSYEEARAAYTRCRWIAPGRGYIDPTKEIDAAAKRMALCLSTAEDEAADQGNDWEEMAEQRAREVAKYGSLNLTSVIEGMEAAATTLSQPTPAAPGAEDARPEPVTEGA